jgi:hypothetical protein
VLGWAAFSDTAIHYVYVKSPLRRCGVAAMLLGAIGARIHYTHETRAGKYITGEMRYDPYQFFTR